MDALMSGVQEHMPRLTLKWLVCVVLMLVMGWLLAGPIGMGQGYWAMAVAAALIAYFLHEMHLECEGAWEHFLAAGLAFAVFLLFANYVMVMMKGFVVFMLAMCVVMWLGHWTGLMGPHKHAH